MPRRTDIKSILVIGAGPIVIGQACEFDYSGTQACRALREEGYRVVLINSNPATIMTDPELADATYIEPITPDYIAKILELEQIDAILPTMGGQTALNAAMALADSGILQRLGVKLIGASRGAIEKAEDRLLFRNAMEKIGLESPKSMLATTEAEALVALEQIGLPAIIRPSFTLGGQGGGIAYNRQKFIEIVSEGLRLSPSHSVLVEESVLGWKEYELEVVRDCHDNCIIVCSIENIDPMGVHTGDSITVAPALTLTDKEYQIMRDAAIAVLREIGVDTGGSNVQFAVNPADGRMVVIEMNPRVSRSSALASKATGFPIARIAAKLAVGYSLDELANDMTRVTPASFEPTIDYIVTKIPRFTFEKFPGSDPTLGTSMKSVGEVMAMGRSFAESLQKALRGLETGLSGLNEVTLPEDTNSTRLEQLRNALLQPTADRLRLVADGFRAGMTVADIHALCKIDPWFLNEIKNIVETEAMIRTKGLPQTAAELQHLKSMGFSDRRLGELTGSSEATVSRLRDSLSVRPIYKRIDSCAAEFKSFTNYFYSTYESVSVLPPLFDTALPKGLHLATAQGCEANVSARKKVIILGGGPNRIGQGIEFDYCCVHAAYALRDAGFETIMINCNPETVSTDYDTSDRLYFEPLSAEDVIAIAKLEQQSGELLGVIVQLGGQTPLKIAAALLAAEIPILGTTVDAIDLAEDRERFQKLITAEKLLQPRNGVARSPAEALAVAEAIGYPVVLRPSYVLGGRAMEVVHDAESLSRYTTHAVKASGDNPVLVDSYLSDAVEVDVDAISDGDEVIIGGIMEHIEEAGIHSGDSACALPPFELSAAVQAEIRRQTVQLAKALRVVGLMNIQFAVQGETVYILEVNPRASRTVPFVAKATNLPLAKLGGLVMVGHRLAELVPMAERAKFHPDHTAVKEAVFPFNRFPGVDIMLGPEMKSTGEVMGIDQNFALAFAKAQLAAGVKLPSSGTCFISVKDSDKPKITEIVRQLIALGFKILATRGTAEFLRQQNLTVTVINKVHEGHPHIEDAMISGQIQMVINTVFGRDAITDSLSLRRAALTNSICHFTTISGARAAVMAISSLQSQQKLGEINVRSIQDYLARMGQVSLPSKA
ncbi:MAG: carbamoyl-phosphate synthase large subunit [Candidatus Pacebacteria bacterium]|nr:carbamoyl-phosphate synthase large subunit [Candidatus Paceibacterota bacterium]